MVYTKNLYRMDAIHNELIISLINNDINRGLFCIGELCQSEGIEYGLKTLFFKYLLYGFWSSPQIIRLFHSYINDSIELQSLVKCVLKYIKTNLLNVGIISSHRVMEIREITEDNVISKEKGDINHIIRYMIDTGDVVIVKNTIKSESMKKPTVKIFELVKIYEDIMGYLECNDKDQKRFDLVFYGGIVYLYKMGYSCKKQKYKTEDCSDEELVYYFHKSPNIKDRRLFSMNLVIFENIRYMELTDNIAYNELANFMDTNICEYWKRLKNKHKHNIDEFLIQYLDDPDEKWSNEEKRKSHLILHRTKSDIVKSIVNVFVKSGIKISKQQIAAFRILKQLAAIEKNERVVEVNPFYDIFTSII